MNSDHSGNPPFLLAPSLKLTAALAVACFAVLPLIPAPSLASAQELTADNIRSEIVGRTLVGRRMGMTMRMAVNADGTLQVRSPMMNGSGTWRLEGNQLCMDIPNRPGRADPCQSFTRAQDGRLHTSGGMKFRVE